MVILSRVSRCVAIALLSGALLAAGTEPLHFDSASLRLASGHLLLHFTADWRGPSGDLDRIEYRLVREKPVERTVLEGDVVARGRRRVEVVERALPDRLDAVQRFGWRLYLVGRDADDQVVGLASTPLVLEVTADQVVELPDSPGEIL